MAWIMASVASKSGAARSFILLFCFQGKKDVVETHQEVPDLDDDELWEDKRGGSTSRRLSLSVI